MKKEIADLWIADLRTNPKQAKGVLFDGEGHCCLGRLCVVMGAKFNRDHGGWRIGGCRSVLPSSVIVKAGMRKRNDLGIIHNGTALSSLNDSGASFSEIADIIEKHWQEL